MKVRVGVPNPVVPNSGLSRGEPLSAGERSGCAACKERAEDPSARDHESLLLPYSNPIETARCCPPHAASTARSAASCRGVYNRRTAEKLSQADSTGRVRL